MRILLIEAGTVVGGLLGFRLLAPPEPPPGAYLCGLGVLPAMFVGLPVGIVLGGLFGSAVGRVIDHFTPASHSNARRH